MSMSTAPAQAMQARNSARDIKQNMANDALKGANAASGINSIGNTSVLSSATSGAEQAAKFTKTANDAAKGLI
jgi:hypothetical protein